MRDETFLLLGGAGLVGTQVARRIISDLQPARVVIGDLVEEGANRAVEDLRSVFPDSPTEIIGEWGDVFLREAFSRRHRDELLEDPEAREGIFADLLGPIDEAYRQSSLARLILQYRPDVIVDCINTATAISYQNVYTTSLIAKQTISEIPVDADPAELRAKTQHDVEALILSQAVPQLIRHVMILSRAMHEAGTRLYLKVGTTGTGGMGLNIPYTHSEDRPSAQLMTKASVAFAHTGLLFLLARTHGEPVVKEVKPAALIGFSAVEYRTVLEHGEPVRLYAARTVPLDGLLELRVPTSAFERLSDLQLPVVDTGENGVFTKGEFEAITSIGQMEYVTPEEVAHTCMQEITGGNTGRDIIAAVDASLLGSSYRAGILRSGASRKLGTARGRDGNPQRRPRPAWATRALQAAVGSRTAEACVSNPPQGAGLRTVGDLRDDQQRSRGPPLFARHHHFTGSSDPHGRRPEPDPGTVCADPRSGRSPDRGDGQRGVATRGLERAGSTFARRTSASGNNASRPCERRGAARLCVGRPRPARRPTFKKTSTSARWRLGFMANEHDGFRIK